MSTDGPSAGSSARQLRAEFDQSFARPLPVHAGTTLRLLGVRVAGDHYALRLTDISAITRRRIVPLPSPAASLAGLVVVRGVLIPAHRLGALLGYPPGADVPGWLALVRADTPLALTFDEVEGYLEAQLEQLCPLPERRTYIEVVASTGAGARPIIELAALHQDLKRRARPALVLKE